MKSENLDRKIRIERSASSQSESGEVTEGWTILAERRASVAPVRGEERFSGEQWVAKEQVEFRIRWDSVVADLSPMDRVIYPIDDPVTERKTYDVMAVHELGRHVGLRIMTARRV